MMPVVTAVSVWPTCAVPVMVGAPAAAVFVAVPPVAVPLTAKIMRSLVRVHNVSVMMVFDLALPMLHPAAEPVSAVALPVETRKFWPLAAALLLVTSQ